MYVSPISSRFSRGRLTPAIRAKNQPCLCLCRGLVQMTRTRPCRLITRQRSHMGLTDALTFIRECGHAKMRPSREGSWYQNLSKGQGSRALLGDGHGVLEMG